MPILGELGGCGMRASSPCGCPSAPVRQRHIGDVHLRTLLTLAKPATPAATDATAVSTQSSGVEKRNSSLKGTFLCASASTSPSAPSAVAALPYSTSLGADMMVQPTGPVQYRASTVSDAAVSAVSAAPCVARACTVVGTKIEEIEDTRTARNALGLELGLGPSEIESGPR